MQTDDPEMTIARLSALTPAEQSVLDQALTGVTAREIAEHLSLSPFHLQRLFTRWAGISPKRFLQYMTVQHALGLLQQFLGVLDRHVLQEAFRADPRPARNASCNT